MRVIWDGNVFFLEFKLVMNQGRILQQLLSSAVLTFYGRVKWTKICFKPSGE